ncbi:MAG: hypothetical protein EOQ92_12830 [Mesorhizobium sp.]|nr:MAG: hypothetical protein EOQ92_12830 [Mesorhizobium sp.]RWK52239.1 MAG: hypothetical protein EOR47_04955 [Mesorhizobium sp.]RWK96864.1 MAG: hypothetical protein EOR53_07970 [Mesorhizobium sp.]RWL12243.1 MAG: hypothetical protein EOR45_04460 [Mesorhizobium sp.]TIQ20738.1 MAG: hypothetical protein E5X51_14665 [Mesorhizobium sp.]
MPAGILSPYSDEERDAVIDGFANHQRCRKGRRCCGQLFLPVTIRGEMPGRAMRGSADIENCPEAFPSPAS